MVRQSHLKRILFLLTVSALINILLVACAGKNTINGTNAPTTTTQPPQINYGLPPWWTDNTGKRVDCDKYNYIQGVPGVDPTTIKPLATWHGLEACGPLPSLVPPSQPDNYVYFFHGASQEQEFECTELVKRYLYMAYGLAPLGKTNGNQVVGNYTAKYSMLHKVLNDGTVQITPMEGDVLSYSLNHTAIVAGVNKDGSINVIQQNVAWNGVPVPTETLQVRNSVIQPSTHGAGSVISWMTMRNVPAVLGASTQAVPTDTPTPPILSTGTCTGQATSNGGSPYQTQLVINSVNGNSFTGSYGIAGPGNSAEPIQDGQISGNTITFTTPTQVMNQVSSYKATISGNQMNGTWSDPGGESGTFILTKSS